MASSSSAEAEKVVPKEKEDKEYTPGDMPVKDDEATLDEEEKLEQGDTKVWLARSARTRARTRCSLVSWCLPTRARG